MVSVNYSLVGSNGDTIEFDYSSYILNPEFTGFGIPTAEVRIEASAGDGGVFRHSKRGVRSVDMAITVLGTDRADVQSKLRRLSRLLQDSSGPTRIVATYSDNTSVFLEGHYVGGAESQWGSDAGLVWNRWALSFQCPNPFWRSSIVQQFTIGTGDTGRGLLPQLTKMKVSSSQTLGVVQVNNQGDVAAYPIWEITGPVTNIVISNGTQSFGFDQVLPGEVFYVNTETGTVTDVAGTNQYAKLKPAPKLFVIPPGISSMSVTGLSDQGFLTKLTYSPRFEVVH